MQPTSLAGVPGRAVEPTTWAASPRLRAVAGRRMEVAGRDLPEVVAVMSWVAARWFVDPRRFLWASSMDTYLLERDLKYGPLVGWFITVLQRVDKDSDLRAHTIGDYHFYLRLNLRTGPYPRRPAAPRFRHTFLVSIGVKQGFMRVPRAHSAKISSLWPSVLWYIPCGLKPECKAWPRTVPTERPALWSFLAWLSLNLLC